MCYGWPWSLSGCGSDSRVHGASPRERLAPRIDRPARSASITRRPRRHPAGLCASSRPRRHHPPAVGDADAATPTTDGRATACQGAWVRRRASSRHPARTPARLHRALRRGSRRRSHVPRPAARDLDKRASRRPTAARADGARDWASRRRDRGHGALPNDRPGALDRPTPGSPIEAGRYADALTMPTPPSGLARPAAGDSWTAHRAISRSCDRSGSLCWGPPPPGSSPWPRACDEGRILHLVSFSEPYRQPGIPCGPAPWRARRSMPGSMPMSRRGPVSHAAWASRTRRRRT